MGSGNTFSDAIKKTPNIAQIKDGIKVEGLFSAFFCTIHYNNFLSTALFVGLICMTIGWPLLFGLVILNNDMFNCFLL